jgi:pimeloyl-ACP methyl ester carboxylesterase
MIALVAVLVVLAALFLGGGGLYFAGQIDSDGLTATHAVDPVRYDLVVDSFSGGQVVLHRSGEQVDQDPLPTADEYGLAWPGGRGVVTGAPQTSAGGRVGRSLRVTTGTAPAPGTRATLQRDVWTDPRNAYGVDYQDVTYPCAGGRCPAWFVPGTSSTWMVLVHGKGASRTEPLRAMGPALKAGLPVLDISYRNDPGAPLDPSRRHAYGVTEWRDLEAAVRYATGHGAKDVVLFGSSMGGSIVASFLGHSTLASRARAVVLDAPALDFRSTVDWGAAHRTLPVVGTPVPDVLTGTAEWMAGWRYGVDWTAMDYLAGRWLRVPALVVHGTDDDTVPISTSDRFRAAHPNLVREVRVRGGTHVGSWNVDPQAYQDRESAFLGCLTSGPSPAC